MSKQGRDNESEAEGEPPDSFSLGVRRIKGLRNSMDKGGTSWYRRESMDRDRGRYENAEPKYAGEHLEDPSQSSLFSSSQLLRLI